MTGAELIAKERQEQIEKHNYTLENDLKYNKQELIAIAKYFLTDHDDAENENYEEYLFKDEDGPKLGPKLFMKYWGKNYKDRLVIAGALIAAEIDRIQNLI